MNTVELLTATFEFCQHPGGFTLLGALYIVHQYNSSSSTRLEINFTYLYDYKYFNLRRTNHKRTCPSSKKIYWLNVNDRFTLNLQFARLLNSPVYH